MQATPPDHQRAGKHGIQEDNDTASAPIVKRMRGGGFDDDDDDYDDSAYMEDDEIEETEDLDGDAMGTTDGADNADTAVNFDDLSADQLKRWSRPPVPESAFDSSQADLHLQWLDMDMVSDQPLPDNPNRAKKRVVGATEGEVPVIRIFGVTDQGNSIVAFIHGYTPYAFFALPEGHELKYDNIREKNTKLGKIRDTMNDRLVSAKSQRSKSFAADANLVQGVQYIEDCKSIMGYSTAHTKFLKVYLQMPSLVPTLKRIMSKMTLPSIVVSTLFRFPNAADWNVVSFILAFTPLILPHFLKSTILLLIFLSLQRVSARSKMYGISKFCTLYPVIMSGSHACRNTLHFKSISSSVSEAMICAPTIGKHPLSVNIF